MIAMTAMATDPITGHGDLPGPVTRISRLLSGPGYHPSSFLRARG